MAVNSVSLENIENHHYYFGIWSSGDSPKNSKPLLPTAQFHSGDSPKNTKPPLSTARIYSGSSPKNAKPPLPTARIYSGDSPKTPNHHYPQHKSVVVIRRKYQTTTTHGTKRIVLHHPPLLPQGPLHLFANRRFSSDHEEVGDLGGLDVAGDGGGQAILDR